MKKPDGVVMLDDDIVGKFQLDDQERVEIEFDRGAAGVRESLEYAAEQGMRFTLMLKPDFNEES